jgi:hypothetical protein
VFIGYEVDGNEYVFYDLDLVMKKLIRSYVEFTKDQLLNQ